MGWGGGLRFTAPGLSSRAAVNLNPPTRRNPEVGGGGGGAVDFFAAAPGVEVEVDGHAARITAMPGDGVGVEVGMVTADCRAENHGINRITAFLPKSGGIRRRHKGF